MNRYASEIEHLRTLGFAEGLPIGDSAHSPGSSTRLECGRAGIAVEFFEPGPVSPYAVVALGAASDRVPLTIHRWDDVVRHIHQHMPPNDD